MPLILNQYESTYRLALWALEEPVSYFEEKAQLSTDGQNFYSKITSESRKKEWLAVRVLLNEVLGFWPQITYTEAGKPILQNHTRHLSITHSKSMVGILLCTNPHAGIDIERTNRNIEKVSRRFLSEQEIENISLMKMDNANILHWCAKEAIFKAVNETNISFSKQILINRVTTDGKLFGNFTSDKEKFDFELNYTNLNEHLIVWTV